MKMKAITLDTGVALVPADFLTVRTYLNANYAGVLMDDKGIIPEIVFTSKKPVSEYTAEEEEEIIQICRAVYPEIFSFYEEQVKEIESEKLNKEKWLQIPKIGIRPLQETNDIRDTYFYGAIIREQIDYVLLQEKYGCEITQEENEYELL